MKKRVVAGILGTILALGTLAGCGANGNVSGGDNGKDEKGADTKTIKVAASSTPHGEILEEAKKVLEEDGYKLSIKVFSDYVQPNLVVESGEYDANFFQHGPYLDNFNAERGTDLVSAGKIHYEPLGIYGGEKSSLEEIDDGDTIAVPNDATNEARALLLLEENGILKLKEEAGINATINDIEEYIKKVEIKELEAAQIPRVTKEMSFVVLNGNYALEAGFSVSKDALAFEAAESEAAKTYANVVAVKSGQEDSEGIKKLIEVLQSDDIKSFIDEKYDGAVLPIN